MGTLAGGVCRVRGGRLLFNDIGITGPLARMRLSAQLAPYLSQTVNMNQITLKEGQS